MYAAEFLSTLLLLDYSWEKQATAENLLGKQSLTFHFRMCAKQSESSHPCDLNLSSPFTPQDKRVHCLLDIFTCASSTTNDYKLLEGKPQFACLDHNMFSSAPHHYHVSRCTMYSCMCRVRNFPHYLHILHYFLWSKQMVGIWKIPECLHA